MKTQITIAGVESNNGRIVLKSSDNKSYSFFQTKQDGNQTTAAEGYNKLRPIAGDTVIAEVNEKQGTSKTGAPIVFRNIAWFYTDGSQMETAQAPKVQNPYPAQQPHEEIPTIHMEDLDGSTPTVPQQSTDETMRIVNDLANRLKIVENRLSLLESVVTGVNTDSGEKINIDNVPF